MDLVIRSATIAGYPGLQDIGIDGGVIAAITDHIEGRGTEEIQADGHLVSPGFVDTHLHLDKCLVLDRYDWGEREYQATSRLTAVHEGNKVKPSFTVEDVRDRAIRHAVMCASHGTTTIRTHAEVDPVVGLTGMRGVLQAREACREFIDMQIVCNAFCGYYYGEGFAAEPDMDRMFREAIELGCDAVGGVTEGDPDGKGHVDYIFSLAREYDKGVDFHCDQITTPPPFYIPYIAEKTMAEGMQGRVLLGHCHAIAHVGAEERQRAIGLLSEAGVSMCITPFTTVQERLLEPSLGGVTATYMTDNVQDTWQPFGNGDMLLLSVFVARLGTWRSSREMDRIFDIGTIDAARAIGIEGNHGVEEGKAADLVILEASSRHEAVVNQVRKLWVIKGGKPVAREGQMLVRPSL